LATNLVAQLVGEVTLPPIASTELCFIDAVETCEQPSGPQDARISVVEHATLVSMGHNVMSP
jgi:hypothetical protein